MSLEGLTIDDPRVQKFIADTKATAKEHDIEVILSIEKLVDGCSGIFTEEALKVGCGQPLENWFPTMVHESCHMDQFIEKEPIYTSCNVAYGKPDEEEEADSSNITEMWIYNIVELTDEQRNKYIDLTRSMELDCEKRTVKKIVEYNLPIDINEYIQKANAYMYLYTMYGKKRAHGPKGQAPYFFEEIWSKMPISFLEDYDTMSQELVDLYEKWCFTEHNHPNKQV